MNHVVSTAALLLFAASAPVAVRAGIIDISDVEITAFASFNTRLRLAVTDFDAKTLPSGSLTRAEALVQGGIPFPNIPNSVGSGFASSASDANSFFGVGVNGFFFQNSLPPNAFLASGTFTQTITNNSTATVGIDVEFFGSFAESAGDTQALRSREPRKATVAP